MTKQWLTSTVTHDLPGRHVDRFVLPPETAETFDGMVRRFHASGQEFTSGPGWVAFSVRHAAMGEGWESRTRLVWTDANPDIERS